MTSAKNIINFQFYIYMCVCVCVCFTLSSPPRSKQTMTGRMDDQMDVKHHFIHLSRHCRALACVPSLPIGFTTSFTICNMCIPLFLRSVGVNRPWRDGWMIGWMWSIISSICPIIAGLWHVCHLFLLFSLPRHICIPLFFRPVRINRSWRDEWMIGWMNRWMTEQMDEMMLHDILYSM